MIKQLLLGLAVMAAVAGVAVITKGTTTTAHAQTATMTPTPTSTSTNTTNTGSTTQPKAPATGRAAL